VSWVWCVINLLFMNLAINLRDGPASLCAFSKLLLFEVCLLWPFIHATYCSCSSLQGCSKRTLLHGPRFKLAPPNCIVLKFLPHCLIWRTLSLVLVPSTRYWRHLSLILEPIWSWLRGPVGPILATSALAAYADERKTKHARTVNKRVFFRLWKALD